MQTMLICTTDICCQACIHVYYALYIVHALLTYPIRACTEARLLRATGLYAFDPFDFQASIRDVLVCKPGFYPRLYGISFAV